MTKYVVLALMSVAAISVFGQVQSYKNRTYDFSIQLPSDWQTSEPGLVEAGGQKTNYALIAQSQHAAIAVTVNDLYASNANGNESQPLSRKDIDDSWSDKKNIAAFQEKLEQRLRQSPDFRLYENGVVQLDGGMALYVRYSGTGPFADQKMTTLMSLTYVLTRNGMSFAIVGFCPTEYYPTEKEAITNAIRSFHVNPLPVAVLEGTPKPKGEGFFKRIFVGIVDSIATNVLLWVAGLVIAAIVAGVSGIGALVRRRRRT